MKISFCGVRCLLQVKKPPRKPIEEEFDDDLYSDLYSDLSVSTAGDNVTEYEVSLSNNTSALLQLNITDTVNITVLLMKKYKYVS